MFISFSALSTGTACWSASPRAGASSMAGSRLAIGRPGPSGSLVLFTARRALRRIGSQWREQARPASGAASTGCRRAVYIAQRRQCRAAPYSALVNRRSVALRPCMFACCALYKSRAAGGGRRAAGGGDERAPRAGSGDEPAGRQRAGLLRHGRAARRRRTAAGSRRSRLDAALPALGRGGWLVARDAQARADSPVNHRS